MYLKFQEWINLICILEYRLDVFTPKKELPDLRTQLTQKMLDHRIHLTENQLFYRH